MGYDFTGGRILDFPIDFSMGITTVQRGHHLSCNFRVESTQRNSKDGCTFQPMSFELETRECTIELVAGASSEHQER